MNVLTVTDLSVRLGESTVVSDVSLHVRPGEVVGLIGPNGAGKTTLFRAIAGEIDYVTGKILLNGAPLPRRAENRARAGLARTFQLVQIFGEMSVRDHLLVALQAEKKTVGLRRDLRGAGRATREEKFRCDRILDLVSLRDVADEPASSLSLGDRRTVELARALVVQPVLVLADEPTSGLDDRETAEFIRVVNLVREAGETSFVLVEHDFDVMSALSDRVYAMSEGRVVGEGLFRDVVALPDVARGWLGQRP